VRKKINLALGLSALVASVVQAAASPVPTPATHAAPSPVIGVGLIAVAATAAALIFSLNFFRNGKRKSRAGV
jgi:hypothetical protein